MSFVFYQVLECSLVLKEEECNLIAVKNEICIVSAEQYVHIVTNGGLQSDFIQNTIW